mmetsp:Transcript_41611/g.89329  ORF Transcript_41611/g.89329 Transcript_41611/m.89329 type:complete len:268 (+) Transcript_41611:1869-2672(+)
MSCAAMVFFGCVESVDFLEIGVLVGREGLCQVAPPLVDKVGHQDLEPGGPRLVWIVHGLLELSLSNPASSTDLLLVGLKGQFLTRVKLVEQNMIDLVLTPRSLGPIGPHIGGPVVQAQHVLKALGVQLRSRNSELMSKLADRCVLHPHVGSLGNLIVAVVLAGSHAVERVATAGVGPDIGEGYLRRCPLLEKHLSVRVEEDDRERSVQNAARLSRQELVAIVLAVMSHDLVHVVDDDAHVFAHEVVLGHALCRPDLGTTHDVKKVGA